MIKYNNAVRTARSMLGTPYSEIDCIRLIVMIIRRTPGGDADYRCEGTNWLWRSTENAKKYRHLEWTQEGIENARGGMLAFKRDGDDVHHVGFVTREGTVIHSSSVYGMVVETPLDNSWHLLARHKLIEPAGEAVSSLQEDGHVGAGFYSARTDDGEQEEQSPSPTKKTGAHTGEAYGEERQEQSAYTTLIREDGVMIRMQGVWRAAAD